MPRWLAGAAACRGTVQFAHRPGLPTVQFAHRPVGRPSGPLQVYQWQAHLWLEGPLQEAWSLGEHYFEGRAHYAALEMSSHN